MQLLSYPLILGVQELPFFGPLLKSLIGVLAALLWAGSIGFLFYDTSIWQFGKALDAQLDERQNIVRNYVYRDVYITLSAVVLFAFLYAMIAVDYQW